MAAPRQNATDGDILRFALETGVGLGASVAAPIRFGLLERGLHAGVPRIQRVLADERAARDKRAAKLAR